MQNYKNNGQNGILSGVIWKFLERFGVQGIHFLLQIVLARILGPEYYGVLSIMTIFVTLANILIQTGFNTSLIQNKDVTEEDYSSVFWVTLGIAAAMYGLIYLGAPVIADFYAMPDIVAPLRVLALMIFPGAMNSIQLAKISRELDFKKVFISNVFGIFISGIVGIAVAYMGGGLWALVSQSLLNVCIACIVMFFTVKWRPRLICNWKRVGLLFRFGWKLLASATLETLYTELSSLVIGKKYDSGTLGYYSRGKQFPQLLISAVNGTVQSVMLPAMSAKQDDKEQVKNLMRTSMTMSAYIVFPMMTGMAAVAVPLVTMLLSDKWLPCVPYMQVYCFSMALHPVHSCNLQAINAIGRSDLFLKLEIIKKSYGLLILSIAVFCFQSPMAIAMTGLISVWISWFVNAAPNKKLIGYSYKEQALDIFPLLLMSVSMCIVVLLVGKWCQTVQMLSLSTILIQVITGVVVYLLMSLVFRPKPFLVLLDYLIK